MRRITLATTAVLSAATMFASPLAQASSHRHCPKPGPSRAVQVYTDDAKPLAKVGGVNIGGSGYGSSFVAKPNSRDHFYGLTDRGPNVDGAKGTKVLPMPEFQPAIGEFKLEHGKMKLVRRIGLAGPQGQKYNGYVNGQANTGETMTDINGKVLPTSPWGYDPEGLVALKDGSFWVSDEYGPFITHFDKHGRQIGRLSPFDGSLPAELAEREPNKGMEGLTVTPDGKTLVGVMQAALNAPDGAKSKKVSALRIVTIDLRTHKTHEYVYVLHNQDGADSMVSEIAALNSHEFVVDERDSNYEPGANKKLYRIDLRKATDVGPSAKVKGATYDAKKGGLLIGGKTIEAIAGKGNTEDTTAALTKAGVTPVKSKLFLDVAGLVSAIDPTGGYFGHDKLEGVAIKKGGNEVYISNDSDFGIDGIDGTKLHVKTLPNGKVDSGEVLRIDMRKVPNQFKR